MFIEPVVAELPALRQAIDRAYRSDETACVNALIEQARLPAGQLLRIQERARALVEQARRQPAANALDAFLQEYDVSSAEGIALMCLAEALLRIPDAQTADALIEDRLAHADWEEHLGQAESLLVNAGTWALLLTGRLLQDDPAANDFTGALRRVAARSGEPLIRAALRRAMRLLGEQFVLGQTMGQALRRAREGEAQGYRYSFDMLGEAARSAAQASGYFEAYRAGIAALAGGEGAGSREISVKLSALHPRFEEAQRDRVLRELLPRIRALAEQARQAGIGLIVDAEEAERLELQLDVLEQLCAHGRLAGWDGLGLAVQAYQKRALGVIDWLGELARRKQRRLRVRLVKGAYWDAEIKRAQELGLDGYPVFTRKAATDVSYLACMRRLLAQHDVLYPQFGTHNAFTIAAVLESAPAQGDFELQRLQGMGEALYDPLLREGRTPCRVYAPVGDHKHLLPYLLRRLLENGANTSFVNRLRDAHAPVEALIADPVAQLTALDRIPHPRIPLPAQILGAARRNSRGIDFSSPTVRAGLARAMSAADGPWRAAPIVSGREQPGAGARDCFNPADLAHRIGQASEASPAEMGAALEAAAAAAKDWPRTPVESRAACLERAADLLEERQPQFLAMLVREGGRTLPNAVAETREAVDYCRYYAQQARQLFAIHELPGITGERNELSQHGRGVLACISPWNFPLAIFLGQVVAALVAGNTVVAKPAEQTPLVAAAALRLLLEAGIPGAALQLLPGGARVGTQMVSDPRVAGVLFTGSLETAQTIQRTLAARSGPIATLVAETGGVNAMIVDSTSLAEQVVDDVLRSAFDSAGQRCSALRVLCVQDAIADELLALLAGAMAELKLGNPAWLATDVGPVIDAEAQAALQREIERLRREAKMIAEVPVERDLQGHFIAPCAFEIESLAQIPGEIFGPVLQVLRWETGGLDALVDSINATGYALTAGIHTRIESRGRELAAKLRAGNVYVNRNMIGAVVGVQPFGGTGLSGTGPKAGGPDYLRRLVREQAVSINTAAMGGNASLLAMDDDESTAR